MLPAPLWARQSTNDRVVSVKDRNVVCPPQKYYRSTKVEAQGTVWCKRRIYDSSDGPKPKKTSQAEAHTADVRRITLQSVRPIRQPKNHAHNSAPAVEFFNSIRAQAPNSDTEPEINYERVHLARDILGCIRGNFHLNVVNTQHLS